eukprot:Sspe_Gene.55593::Locus_30565_Transcript_2_2_Confidence_0.750_Length_840::g.55593::m.55593/K03661/ATPeV0B, ATP6F; V-type H+-transporting ATPase 21kDa proteolipid subunit
MGNLASIMKVVRHPDLDKLEREHTTRLARQEPDVALSFLKAFFYYLAYLVIFLFVILPLLGGHLTLLTDFTQWWYVLASVSPWAFAALGVSFAIGISVIGAAWGILLAGGSIAGASIRKPEISSRNLISIIFCEAVGVYGLILALLMNNKINYPANSYSDHRPMAEGLSFSIAQSCYTLFCAGLCVGFGNLACGLSVGLVGSSCALADAADRELFVQVLIVEIFASALGIFALIIGILQTGQADFKA